MLFSRSSSVNLLLPQLKSSSNVLLSTFNFVKYLSSDDNIKKIAASGLITPAKKKVAYSEYFTNGDVFLDVIEKSTPNLVPSDYNIITDKIKVESKSVLGGYKSAKEAFKKF